MSDQIHVLLPKLGESIHSATVVRWFKKVGDFVRLDEALLEVSTDKVNSEIPSPAAGVVVAIHAEVDKELPVGGLLAVIAAEGGLAAPSLAAPLSAQTGASPEGGDQMKGFFSPAFLRIAREQGIDMKELESIPGSGMGGRVTKSDLEEYIEKRKAPKQAPCPLSLRNDVERVKMSGMRKAIADNMARSFYSAPHATLVAEVDVTIPLKYIAREKEAFAAQYGCKLTITAFVVHAMVAALKEYPLINSSLEEDTILLKRFINVGIAVSVDQGLLVPVIKNTQEMTLPQIAQAIGSISFKARSGKLAPEDVREGTITVTNFGMSGVQIGVPIIRYPEVAIIGAGAICKRVVPLEDDLLAIRSMMHISLTFDHRVLDGMYGCGFLGAVKKHLERL
jgi:2-oxoglutarate dehydrogenase E2 component (dihydrolipoamide succinyltransferase)